MNTPTKPNATLTLRPDEPKKPKKVWLQSVHGPMLHLHTNTLFTQDPKQHVIDDFVQAQLDAGKLVEFTE